MAPALPGQLGPVRLLGWQRFLSVRVRCPRGRKFCSLGSVWGSLSPACFVLNTLWWKKCKWVSNFAGVPFSLSLSKSSPCILQGAPADTQRYSHQTHTCIYRDTHIHTQMDLNTLTHSYPHTLTHVPIHSGTHTVLNPHSHMITVPVSGCLTHAPCLSTWCQAICCLYSFPVFVYSSCSFLPVPISF